MSDTRDLKWLSVEITPENIEELGQYTEYKLNSFVYLPYYISTDTFERSYNLVPKHEKVIPNFSNLTEFKLLMTLGISKNDAYKQVWGNG